MISREEIKKILNYNVNSYLPLLIGLIFLGLVWYSLSSSGASNLDFQIIAAFTALAAVIMGPLIQWVISDKQSRHNVSSLRLKWIDELRDIYSKLSTLRRELFSKSLNKKYKVPTEKFDQLMYDTVYLRNKLILMLNPEKKDQKNLINLTNEIAGFMNDSRNTCTTLEEMEKKIREYDSLTTKSEKLMQKVLKTHWKKVWVKYHRH